jgi:2-methylisocitrate lyase-like PEP mutase family enzyme
MGLIFPRNPDEAARAPKLTQVPLIYVQSLGNRDGRPTFSRQELQTMGYAGCIEAQFAMLYAFAAMKKALQALGADGRYDGMDQAEYVAARQAIEDIIDPTNTTASRKALSNRAGRRESIRGTKAMALPEYELYAIRYAMRDAQRRPLHRRRSA